MNCVRSNVLEIYQEGNVMVKIHDHIDTERMVGNTLRTEHWQIFYMQIIWNVREGLSQ